MKIKVHADYDYFPDNVPLEGEPYINAYFGDYCAKEEILPKSIAVILEPISIEHVGYDFVKKHSDKFQYIFTHDSELLKLPNARFNVWGTVWDTADIPKTKGISMISSHKEVCELHLARTKLAKQFDGKGKVDCFGTFRDPSGKTGRVNTHDSHAEYRFAIAFENYIDDYWFTEKILNCFSNKTVPIYYGARRIGEFFNTDGIIQVDDWRKIPEIVDNLDVETEYEKRRAAIDDNFERVKPYQYKWRDRFLKEYGSILEEMLCI